MRRVRVHVHNDPGQHPVFTVTRARLCLAVAAVPELHRRLRCSWSQDRAGLDRGLRTAEILLAGSFPAEDLARRAPGLRWIQSTNAGVEDVLPHLPPGVILTNASGVHPPKAAEFALTALLALQHGLPHFATCQRQHRWDPRYTTGIAGRTLLVIGVGRIGGAVAHLARRFGLRVLGVRRSGQPQRWVHRMYRPGDLPRILPRADFVVVATPLTAETRQLLGPRELDRLPPHAGLVNLGRGAVVDVAALADRLRRGRLGGAVLDVFPEEPLPPDSSLWDTPNLIVTPHCAVDDARAYVPRCLDIFVANLRRYLAGRPLRNRVDVRRGY